MVKTFGRIFLNLFYIWLPWKGVSNQIRINSEPKLKKLVTDYGAPNEVAYFEVSQGVYRVNEILTVSISSLPQLCQADMTAYRGWVKGFATIVKQGICLLGDTMKIQDFLLPKWCRIHHVEHLEMSCIPCQNEITKLMSLVPCEDVDHILNME